MRKDDYIRRDEGYLVPAAQRGLFRIPRRREFLLQHCGEPPKDVLDAGCAGGHVAALLQAVGHRVVGIELNDRMAAEARSRGMQVLQNDLEEPLPLPDACFGVVHACEIIEHLFDTDGFLREMRRLLRPGGTLIMSTPNLNSAGNRLRVLVGRPLPMWGAFPADRHGTHIRVFNYATIQSLLQRTGFGVECAIGVNQGGGRWLFDRFPTWSDLILLKAKAVPSSSDVPRASTGALATVR